MVSGQTGIEFKMWIGGPVGLDLVGGGGCRSDDGVAATDASRSRATSDGRYGRWAAATDAEGGWTGDGRSVWRSSASM